MSDPEHCPTCLEKDAEIERLKALLAKYARGLKPEYKWMAKTETKDG